VTTQLIDDKAAAEFEAFVAGDPGIDRFALFAHCRRHAPVFHSTALGAWVLTRYADVRGVLEDEERFATLREGPGAPVYGPAILQWRGREHQRKGGIVARRLRSPRAVAEMESFVQETCERLADELMDRQGVVDLKTDYSMWIPLLVIGELMDIEGAEQFRDWYHHISAGGVSSIGHPEKRERAFQALADLSAFIEPIIAERREHPGDDLLSDLCTATYDGEPLPLEQIRAMTAFLLTAGVETTERAMSSLLAFLFEDPTRWERLRGEPDLLPSVLAETLRFFPPVHGVTRMTLTDVEIEGVRIPEGDRMLALLSSANRDEDVFERAAEFVFDRFPTDPERQFTNAGQILPFGAGRHHCTGSHLARIEMLHGMRALLTRVAGATFTDGRVPEQEGFLLRSPGAVRVTLQRG
jgi:cytochrome P450